MIYDKVDTSLISKGERKEIFPSKYLTPLFYNESFFDVALKNKYIIINHVKTSLFKKDYIDVKSLKFAQIIESIIDTLKISKSPIFADGVFRANITPNTLVTGKAASVEEIRAKRFQAIIALSIPTFYEDEDGTSTLQVNVKTIHVHEFVEAPELEFDVKKLSLSE